VPSIKTIINLSSISRQMFSHSFASSIKSPQDVAADIARRALPTNKTVRRPPTTSGEHLYTYEHVGFRVFTDSHGNHAENLAHDYEHFIAGGNTTLLPYHFSIAALHHTHATRSMEHFRNQLHIITRLIAAVPKPQPEQPKPKRRHVPDILHPFLLRRKIQHIQQQQAIAHIQRPLSDATLAIAHSVARTQVTAISALHPHQRLRTVAGSLISLLAIRLCCERTNTPAIVNQHLNNYRDSHYVHNLHHDGLHHVLRRASGSQARAIQITAPYTECATVLRENIPTEQYTYIKKYMAARFQSPPPITPESIFGPNSFHVAEYYAGKCLELLGNPAATTATTADPASAARWAKLRTDVQRVRRGELTAYQVIADPGPANDYWVFAIKNTFHHAIQNYLSANTEWLARHDRPTRHNEGRKHINTEKGESIYWPNSKDIRINASRVVQTTLMIRAMYRFVIRASCVLSPEFVGVFGYNMHFIKVLISRAKHLATCDGDESSALTFGHFFPCLMTPDVHLDIFVGGNVFQEPDLYVKMSDPVFGPLKKHFKDVIPSRHTGTVDRATLEHSITIRNRE